MPQGRTLSRPHETLFGKKTSFLTRRHVRQFDFADSLEKLAREMGSQTRIMWRLRADAS